MLGIESVILRGTVLTDDLHAAEKVAFELSALLLARLTHTFS